MHPEGEREEQEGRTNTKEGTPLKNTKAQIWDSERK